MTDKQKRRREEIIETAFRVWSESSFKKTSLSAVATRMGISKTALYRYFSGKEALLQAMEEYFLRLYNHLCDEVIRHRDERSVAEALEAYNRIFVGFFARNSHYLRFAQIRFIRKPQVGDSFLAMTFRRNMDLFPAEPLAREFGWRMAQIPVIVRYILSVSNFLLAVEHCGNEEIAGGAESLLEVNRRLIISGISLNRDRQIPDFQMIEERCILSEGDFPETDRVTYAVSEVVAENGLWNTTVEKIAHRLGMSKSSLYFYFENRDEMLWKLIEQERQAFGALVIRDIEPMESFSDQLYAYFVLHARYLWGRPEFLATMNWYRFQDIAFHPPEDPISSVIRFYRFVEEAVEAGVMSEKVPLLSFLRLLNFLLMQELSEHFRRGNDFNQLFPILRTLHQLLLYGVQGA